jgi:protein gp37
VSDTSKIEWTDATWNVVTGCEKVSPGCDNCYAETFAERWRGTKGHHFETGFDLTLRPERLMLPLRWKKPRKVFVNSMSDLFHKDIPDEYIARVFAVMALTPQHTYQVLTKRHGRMRSLVGNPEFEKLVDYELLHFPPLSDSRLTGRSWPLPKPGWPLPNVWLGVSVEDQKRADLRVPALLETPAAIRFLSCEPLLGPVDLKQAVRTMGSERGHGLTASFVHAGGCCRKFHGIDWVIVGGESGHGARPMSPDWARTLRDQCAAAEVPYLFKQWGEYQPTDWKVIGRPSDKRNVLVGDPIDTLGHRWEMRRVGKKAAGRELDGRTWDEFPEAVAS